MNIFVSTYYSEYPSGNPYAGFEKIFDRATTRRWRWRLNGGDNFFVCVWFSVSVFALPFNPLFDIVLIFWIFCSSLQSLIRHRFDFLDFLFLCLLFPLIPYSTSFWFSGFSVSVFVLPFNPLFDIVLIFWIFCFCVCYSLESLIRMDFKNDNATADTKGKPRYVYASHVFEDCWKYKSKIK